MCKFGAQRAQYTISKNALIETIGEGGSRALLETRATAAIESPICR